MKTQVKAKIPKGKLNPFASFLCYFDKWTKFLTLKNVFFHDGQKKHFCTWLIWQDINDISVTKNTLKEASQLRRL